MTTFDFSVKKLGTKQSRNVPKSNGVKSKIFCSGCYDVACNKCYKFDKECLCGFPQMTETHERMCAHCPVEGCSRIIHYYKGEEIAPCAVCNMNI